MLARGAEKGVETGADEFEMAAESVMSEQALLEVRNLVLQYKTWEHLVTATWNVNFDVQRGDRFVLLGPSGCGK
jgi:NitT/TauT family transport system ATP-binding protein